MESGEQKRKRSFFVVGQCSTVQLFKCSSGDSLQCKFALCCSQITQSRDHISPLTRVEHIHMSSTHQPRYCHNTFYKAYNFSLLVAKQNQGSRDFGRVDHGRSECAALGYRGVGLCYTVLHNVTQNVTHCYTSLHTVLHKDIHNTELQRGRTNQA